MRDALAAHVGDEGVAQLVVEGEPVGLRDLAVGLRQRHVAPGEQLAAVAVVGDLVGHEDLAVVADLDIAACHHLPVPGVVDQLLHEDFQHAALGVGWRLSRKVQGKRDEKGKRSEHT